MKKLLFTYLKFWAKGYLKRTDPEIIAITGSVGKTSTKEAIFEVLQIKYKDNIRKSTGNLNNETGVPLAVLDYKHSPVNIFGWFWILVSFPFKSFFLKSIKILVLELAADKPGDIKYLTSFIKPKIAVLTSIESAHLEAFKTKEKIIEEKTNLLRALSCDGWAILNIDDENIKKISYGGRWQKKTYAIKNNADYRAVNIKTSIQDKDAQTKCQIKWDNEQIETSQNTLGEYANVLATLAAVAVAKVYELTNNQIIEGIKNIKPEKHRMNVIEGKKDILIIDDSYNANPASMTSALNVLKNLPKPKNKGRKIVVIGDMLEIGKDSDKEHSEIGKLAKTIADQVIAVGINAKNYKANKYFKSGEQAGQYLLKEINTNDIILIKASRKIGLDSIADLLRK